MTKRLLGKPSAARLPPSTRPARAPPARALADVGNLLLNALAVANVLR
jgi:hypothetical protein